MVINITKKQSSIFAFKFPAYIREEHLSRMDLVPVTIEATRRPLAHIASMGTIGHLTVSRRSHSWLESISVVVCF